MTNARDGQLQSDISLDSACTQPHERSGGELPVKRRYWLPSLVLGILTETLLRGSHNALRRLLNVAAASGGFAFGFWLYDEAKCIRNEKSVRRGPIAPNNRCGVAEDREGDDHNVTDGKSRWVQSAHLRKEKGPPQVGG